MTTSDLPGSSSFERTLHDIETFVTKLRHSHDRSYTGMMRAVGWTAKNVYGQRINADLSGSDPTVLAGSFADLRGCTFGNPGEIPTNCWLGVEAFRSLFVGPRETRVWWSREQSKSGLQPPSPALPMRGSPQAIGFAFEWDFDLEATRVYTPQGQFQSEDEWACLLEVDSNNAVSVSTLGKIQLWTPTGPVDAFEPKWAETDSEYFEHVPGTVGTVLQLDPEVPGGMVFICVDQATCVVDSNYQSGSEFFAELARARRLLPPSHIESVHPFAGSLILVARDEGLSLVDLDQSQPVREVMGNQGDELRIVRVIADSSTHILIAVGHRSEDGTDPWPRSCALHLVERNAEPAQWSRAREIRTVRQAIVDVSGCLLSDGRVVLVNGRRISVRSPRGATRNLDVYFEDPKVVQLSDDTFAVAENNGAISIWSGSRKFLGGMKSDGAVVLPNPQCRHDANLRYWDGSQFALVPMPADFR